MCTRHFMYTFTNVCLDWLVIFLVLSALLDVNIEHAFYQLLLEDTFMNQIYLFFFLKTKTGSDNVALASLLGFVL